MKSCKVFFVTAFVAGCVLALGQGSLFAALDPAIGVYVDDISALGPPSAPTARLDVNNTVNIINALNTGTDYATVLGYLSYAYNYGGWDVGMGSGHAFGTPWTGLGLGSSAAKNSANKDIMLGIASGADYVSWNGPTLYGETVQPGWVLVNYTWAGDVNLDGMLTGDDVDAVNVKWAADGDGSVAKWWEGDINHDGLLTGDDIDALNITWANGDFDVPVAIRVASVGASTAAVPEPATAVMALMGALCAVACMFRKRRS